MIFDMMRYKRQLSEGAYNYLIDEGKKIIPKIKSARKGDDDFGLDIQIRQNDTLQVYRGNTSILEIKISNTSRKLTFSAHETYFDDFLGTYDFSGTPIDKIPGFIERTIPKVAGKYFKFKKEGYYQNLMCYRYGEKADFESPFIVFDRECVIGFGNKKTKENKEKKEETIRGIVKPYKDISIKLQAEARKMFGTKEKMFGDEADLLAIDKDLNLLCIELKHGSSASGIYWGPLQVAVYRELFSRIVQENGGFFNDIKELVLQKVKMNLLPQRAEDLFKEHGRFAGVKSILAIVDPLYNGEKSWQNTLRTMKAVIQKDVGNLGCDICILNKNGDILEKEPINVFLQKNRDRSGAGIGLTRKL